jgi:hypothetical protein
VGKRSIAARRSYAGDGSHTAIVVGSAQQLPIGLVALVVALILLVVASSIPLWLFSILVSLVYAFIVPFAALAMTLLYGDAVAEREAVAPAEVLEPV